MACHEQRKGAHRYLRVPLERVEWLPNRDTQLTNHIKTVSEVIPCYYRYIKKQKRLFAGKKPSGFSKNTAITERDWQSTLSKNNRENPIKEGQKYLDYLNSSPDYKYRDGASFFGVSVGRVSQMIALIKKLPQEILDYFLRGDVSDDIQYLTERKLRPLTLLVFDDMKVEKFLQMLKINLNL